MELPYSEKAYLQELTYLNDKAAAMSAEDEASYPQTDDESQCASCPYRAYCGRDIPQEEEPAPDYEDAFQTSFNFPDLPLPDDTQEVNF